MRHQIVCVFGSRDGWEYANVARLLEVTLTDTQIPEWTIISGGARGVDTFAEQYAKFNGHSFVVFNADWNGLGKSAGFVRNGDMVFTADAGVAFWDGFSRGTADSIQKFIQAGKPLMVHKADGTRTVYNTEFWRV